MLILSIAGFLILDATLLALVTWKYRSVFHPLLFPLATLGIMAGLAPLAQLALQTSEQPEQDLIAASGLSSLYVCGLALPLLTNLNPLLPLLAALLRPVEVVRRDRLRPAYLLLAALAWCGFVAGFLLLMRDSSAGTRWLVDPRMSYIVGRAGVGHWYVASQACLFLSLLLALYFGRVRHPLWIAALTLGCAGCFVYFGSKSGVLGVLVAAAVYYHHYVRPVSAVWLLPVGGALLPVVLISPWLQGSFDSLLATLSYYDYFDNTAMYLSESPRIGLRYGGSLLSSFWEYVPRGFFPDKPFIYGSLVINDYFWPGSAEVGYTPALLPWTAQHLDFGVAGVAVGGLATGFLHKAVYAHFLRTRSFVAYLAFLQVCFIPVLKCAPPLYFAMLLLLLALGTRSFVFGLACAAGKWNWSPSLRRAAAPEFQH